MQHPALLKMQSYVETKRRQNILKRLHIDSKHLHLVDLIAAMDMVGGVDCQFSQPSIMSVVGMQKSIGI